MAKTKTLEKKKNKQERRNERRLARRVIAPESKNTQYTVGGGDNYKPIYATRTFKPKNREQEKAINSINNSKITVISGVVGSGKTFLAAARATELLLDPDSPIDKIYLIRAPEPLGKSVGFLPGDIVSKMTPFLIPILDGVEFIVGAVGKDRLIAQGKLDYVLVEHLRGRTFNNAVVIFDECNNLTSLATAVALLRTGRDCKMIFCGDERQSDIANSGMRLFYKLLEEYENVPFALTELTDVVRSDEASAFAYMFDELGIKY